MDGRRERSGRDDDDNSDRGSGAHIHAAPGLPQLPWNQDAVTQGLNLASACVVRAWVTKGSSILHHLRFGPVGMNNDKMFNSEVKKELHGRESVVASVCTPTAPYTEKNQEVIPKENQACYLSNCRAKAVQQNQH